MEITVHTLVDFRILVERGMTKHIAKLLSLGVGPDDRHPLEDGPSNLSLAIMNEYYPIVFLLLAYGARVFNGEMDRLWSIDKNQSKILNLLIRFRYMSYDFMQRMYSEMMYEANEESRRVLTLLQIYFGTPNTYTMCGNKNIFLK